MITSVPFSALLAPKDNPRRAFDKKAIEGLAQSIKKDGVIHNLTVQPEGRNKYRVVAGKRRYLALAYLNKKGEIAASYKVPIRFDKKASAEDLSRIATVENVQREQLDPIDEAEAFVRLLGKGTKIDDVSAETGVSVPMIKRRVALADLTPEVKEAVRTKLVSLSVAEVLTLATPDKQKLWLKDLKRNPGFDARYLRSVLLDEKPSAAIALFPLEKYQGTYTRDLFGEKEATYFDDCEQFMTLQREAVDALAEQHRKDAAWVEVSTDHAVSWWQYRQAKKKEPSGVIIHLAPSGHVEVRKGLVRQEVDKKAAQGKGEEKKPRERPAVSKVTWRYLNAHRTLALQMALMENPRKAKEATAALLLNGCPSAAIGLRAHEALRELAQRPGSSNAYEIVDTTCRKLLGKLGIGDRMNGETPAWAHLHHAGADWTRIVSGIRSLSAAELDALIALSVILCFGAERMEAAEPEETFFSSLAKDLALDMRKVWTPDELFLSGLVREELVKVAKESGALAKQPKLAFASKKELVAGLAGYFKRTADPKAQLDESDAKGHSWLPSCMAVCTSSMTASTAKCR
ncbi:MAG: ParB/RepB/Spo0J family partition protein [Enhydrobacter sp.]|nr:MAG: ParB/RepB/Spo0J family partition protein [Enhydrobacter sp.]